MGIEVKTLKTAKSGDASDLTKSADLQNVSALEKSRMNAKSKHTSCMTRRSMIDSNPVY